MIHSCLVGKKKHIENAKIKKKMLAKKSSHPEQKYDNVDSEMTCDVKQYEWRDSMPRFLIAGYINGCGAG